MKCNLINKYLFSIFLVFIFCEISYAGILTEVFINKSVIINLNKPSERVSITSSEIADLVVISPKQIVVHGKAIGSTTLIVWEKDGKSSFFDIKVKYDISELEKEIKASAPDDNIKVELANDTIILSGSASSQQRIEKVAQIAQAYAPQSEITTTTKYSAGLTESESKSTGKVINHISIKNEQAQQILLEVRVAQIDKSKLKELGVSFLVKGKDAEITAPGFVASPTGKLGGENAGFNASPGIEGFDLEKLVPQVGVTHFPSGVSAFLRALSNKGLAKILAEPNLVVKSRGEGQFFAGTKVPVQTVTGTPPTPSIEYEEVGIKLNFKPEVLETKDSSGKDEKIIRLKIDPAEVSNIIRFITFGNLLVAPEIDTREVKTTVDLKEDESLILAGLLSEDMKKNIQKIPILGDVPILGAIFRSTSDELKKKELVFFITPKFVKTVPPGEKKELPGEKSPTPEEEKEFQWIPIP